MVFLYIPDIGLLQHSQHPETAMSQTPEEEVQKIKKYMGNQSVTIVNDTRTRTQSNINPCKRSFNFRFFFHGTNCNFRQKVGVAGEYHLCQLNQ